MNLGDEKWYLYIDVYIDNDIDIIIDIIDKNVDANNIDIDTIDINIDININDTNDIDIKSIDVSNFNFLLFDENFVRFKVDRNNMLMSSYFACTHVFDPNFLNLLLEIHENSKKHRFYQFFDRSKIWLIDQSMIPKN